MRAKLDADREKADRQHKVINCPRCAVELVEKESDNVKIDSCPKCGGVWLDSGELEQLRLVNKGRGVTGGVLSSLFRRDCAPSSPSGSRPGRNRSNRGWHSLWQAGPPRFQGAPPEPRAPALRRRGRAILQRGRCR
ncbi:MAG: zf-TFIIB domain-containing protein [Gemmatimonadaceae bacterium]|nr:zf-TFIIB domain-containing protein [Gemmatimonadaceae bacterium]